MKSIGCGTLVVAVVKREGIYLAADSRRTGRHDDVNKLFPVGPHAIGAIRGSAMLEDAENPSNNRLFARHFANLLPEPLPTTKGLQNPTNTRRYMATNALMDEIEQLLASALVKIEEDWQSDKLTPEALEQFAQKPSMFGLTIAQSEPGGWLLLIDLTCQISQQEGRFRAKFGGTSTKVLYDNLYEADLFKPFSFENCEAQLPDQEAAPGDAEAMIDRCFDTTIKSSTECEQYIGGSVDIAVTSGGVVRVVRHKPQPAPYFPQ